MVPASWITSWPFWVTFLIITIFGILTVGIGIRIGRRRIQENVKDEDSMGTVVGALLGLLAFMLAFTFSLTESRFSNRKALVIEQAKALGTLYLRTSYIPEKQKNEIRKLLREYIDKLVDVSSASNREKNIARMEEILRLIWNQTASLADENMDGELRSLFIGSVNDAINIFGERKTVALIYRIPNVIWNCLLLLYMLSMLLLGFEFKKRKKRIFLDITIIAAAFALIVALIADMDSTTRVGRFRVNQQPLIDIQKMVQQDIR